MDDDELADRLFPNIRNRAMARKLATGEALSVRAMATRVSDDGEMFDLREFIEDKDYCDPEREAWIWSIGQRKSDGRIQASTDSRLYENDAYECLWLR